MFTQKVPLRDRLATKITIAEDGCWQWTGAIGRAGYGSVYCGDGRKGAMLAHRAVFELARGPIPVGLDLDHLCRNRACVNPAHLEPVTRRENLRRGERTIAKDLSTTDDPAIETCRRGHPRTPENVMPVKGTTKRQCRACRTLREREYAKARKEALCAR